MFAAVGLFKEIVCPEQPKCQISDCIFAHKCVDSTAVSKGLFDNSLDVRTSPGSPSEKLLQHSQRKRRRLDLEPAPNGTDTFRRTTSLTKESTSTSSVNPRRSISPPLLRKVKGSDQIATSQGESKNARVLPKVAQECTLNPRIVSNSPTSHAVRTQLVRMLHDQFCRLNELAKRSNEPMKQALELSSNEITLLALNEEEKAIKENPSVYANIIKLRIVKLKKMQLLEWKQERLKQIANEQPRPDTTIQHNKAKVIETGLNATQEIAFSSKLSANQVGLDKHGYVIRRPTEAETEQNRKGLETAQGWEQCDRCKSRFQVFPGRTQEDGALTSGGQCKYHPAKPRRPPALDKADKVSKDLMFSCCKENVGNSVGCATAETHVFKVSNPARLETITPFRVTPDDAALNEESRALCFDCEMGYTTRGLELIRLTAVSFPSGVTVVDVLVRPIGEVLDLNSRYSGVWPQDFANARPYNMNALPDHSAGNSTGRKSESLSIVDSPSSARELLFRHLSPSTPLIGHALDNDLNAVRIIHPYIVDTVLLYPHPRGLPVRYGLKMLTKKYLDRDIQVSDGLGGHDSREDAIASGDLVRYKIQDAWAKLKREGWRVDGNYFIAPKARAEAMKDEISRTSR